MTEKIMVTTKVTSIPKKRIPSAVVYYYLRLVFYFLKRTLLFTNCCRWQNVLPSILRLVNNFAQSIYKTQKTRTSAMVGELYFRCISGAMLNSYKKS